MSERGRLLGSTRIAQLDRREFIQRTGALGLAASVPTGLLADRARAAEPRRGGHLRLGSGHGSTSDSIDPSLFTSGYATLLCSAYLNRLTELSNSGDLVPELAESWEAEDGATKWHFKLRDGVEFHNGKTLDADDVIATFNYHRGPDSKSVVNAIAGQIIDISKDGNRWVTFTLSGGNADFPILVSGVPFGIMPAQDGELAPTSGIGTGAYVVDEYNPGVRSALTRNPTYFKSDKAFFDSAELLVILDSSARQNALITNEVDVIDTVEIKTVDLLKRRGDIVVVDVTGTRHYSYPMRTDVEPFDNNDVRLALKFAVDREQLLRKILRGYGSLGNDHPISPVNRYYAADLPQRSYDPDKAKFYLKKAGLETLRVGLSASEAIFGGAVDSVVLYRESAAKAGIDIVVNREPNDGYWSNVWKKKPWSAAFWYGRPTEDWIFSDGYAADAAWNDTFWNNGRFNELLVAARSELDKGKRRQMYGEMQRILSDEGGVLIPLFANYIMAHSSKIAHSDIIAGNLDLDGAKAIERWWFA